MLGKAQKRNTMKYKKLLNTIFEEEQKKESMNINALEQKILSQVSKKNKSHSPFVWVQRMPYAFAAILIFLILGTATVVATENPIKDAIIQLTQTLEQKIQELQKTGEFTVDEHGERIYTGETAKEAEKLHNETRDKIIELKSRPAAERAKTVAYLKAWIDKHLYTAPNMPKQDNIKYSNVVGLNDDPTHHIEIYYSQDYEYQIDPENNKVYDLSIRGARAKDDPEKTYLDNTPRYNQMQLEKMARDFVKTQLPELDLNTLKLEKGSKIGTYFFTWTGTEAMKKITKDAKGYEVCGDVLNPEFYNEQGAPCIMQYESMSRPSIQVGFTQGGQLLNYSNSGF